MMVKKTIAILGNTGRISPGLMEVLMKQDLRLLFISEDESKIIELREKPYMINSPAEIEFLSCEREGCWEADVIVITKEESNSSSLVQKIKEVTTQKTVLVISEESETFDHPTLEQLLPYSRVIEIHLDIPAKEFLVTGNDVKAMTGIKSIFENAGFNIK